MEAVELAVQLECVFGYPLQDKEIELIQRWAKRVINYDIDGVKSPDIRDQVKRLLGRSLEIPGAVRTGAPLYIPKP